MNGFEIQNQPSKGRFMVATKTFAVGDTILEEEPFVSCQFSWNKTYGYTACDHCMRPLETTLENIRRLANDATIQELRLAEYDPTREWLEQFTNCQQCKIRYCSEDCRRDAWSRYHRIGCMGTFKDDDSHPINKLNEIWKKMHYPPETGTIMLIVRLLAMYAQTEKKQEFIETIQSFQTSVVNTEQQIYHKMLGDNFEKQLEQLFAAFRAAFADEQFAMFTTPEAFKNFMGLMGTNCQGIATSPLAEWVRRISQLQLSVEDKAQLDDYIDQIYQKVGDFAGEFLNNEGAGLYLLQSKINHSCAPNAQSTFPYSNDIIVVKAIQPILIGEEICISYLDECQLERSRHSRQAILRENYIFVCNCPKCQLQANDPDETSEDDMETDDEDDEDMDD